MNPVNLSEALNELNEEHAKQCGGRSLLPSWRHCVGKQMTVLALGFMAQFIAPSAFATPVISEVLYDVEIYGVSGTVLDGLTLEGINGANGAVGPIIALSGVIPVDGVFVVADTDAGGATMVANADLLVNFDFQNGPDSITLMDGATILDAVGYGVFGIGEVFAGEGSSASDVPAGSSLARLFADLDQNDNAIDFAVLSAPTPGSVTLLAVPEPGSGFLAMLGLVGLTLKRRRMRKP
jgi:hypothetical protein